MSEALLFDTSVWIDFLNKKSTPEADLLVHYIEKDEQVLLTPTIIQGFYRAFGMTLSIKRSKKYSLTLLYLSYRAYERQ